MARILIAEDEEPVRALVARALAEDGHAVVATADGAEALDMLQSEDGAFDLLLADIKMPVMDGIALALAVARDFPELPILLMTGYADQRERASGLEALICDVIAKPFRWPRSSSRRLGSFAKGKRLARCMRLIHDLALSIVMAWLLGVAANFIRQPLILAYLVAGFLLGPSGLKWVQSEQSINTIAELGLIFMLFMIGLEIDLKKIVRAGNVILVTSAAQILGCFALALGCFSLIGIPLGDRRFDALYLAAAVALSSTVIIVKVLYDKHELDTLPGRITLGVLVLQDLFAILFLAIQPSLNDLHFDVVLVSVVRVGVLLASALLFSRYTLPHLFQSDRAACRSWCWSARWRGASRSAEFAEFLGLSREMGALDRRRLALDLPLCARRHRQGHVAARFLHHAVLRRARHDDPAADALGARPRARSRRLHAGEPAPDGVPAALPMRQGLRASMLPAINLAQISEFSLVLIQVGVQSGQTTPGVAGAASTAFVVLAVLSTFLMMSSDPITRGAIPALKRLGLRDLDQAAAEAEPTAAAERKRRILLLGFYRVASSFLSELERRHAPLLEQVFVVDFNPTVYHIAAGARREDPLRRHRPRRHAGACRHRRCRDRHFQRAGLAAEGHQQREARPPCAHGQSDGEDHRHRGRAGGGARCSTPPAPTT